MNMKDKCTEIIQRLSSRLNHSATNDNCNTTRPFCIDKSFYQHMNDVGHDHCVEVCGNNCYPMISNFDGRFCNSNKFLSSGFCDNRNDYIDYILTNVLSQVVNHIPFDCLNQLSCSLRNKIEDILCQTDMDSDRLIRMLVMDVLHCYSINTKQFTDWYAFANLTKSLIPSTQTKDQNVNQIFTSNSKLSVSPKQQTKSTSNTRPTTPLIKKELSSDTITSKSQEFRTPSINSIYSPRPMTPMSTHSKEEFTPVGSKYQSKTKSNQISSTRKQSIIDNHQESLPFHNEPTNKKLEDSSSSDCVLTIHHKHKHKHKHLTTTTTATSYHTPISIPIKEYLEKSKSVNVQDEIVEIKPGENINFNSINTEELKSCELLNEKQLLTLKSFSPTKPNTIESIFASKISIKDEKSHFINKKLSRINHHPNMLADFD